MDKFKAEEWQNYLDNMVPGYSRTVNNNNTDCPQSKNVNKNKETFDERIKIN